jgi:hypothetical protein
MANHCFSRKQLYLGVKIDHILQFDSHVEYVKNKVAKKVGFLRRIGDSLSQWSRQLVYNTTIAPHFNYCFSILAGLNNQDLSTLQKLQNRGMRAILQCHYLTHRVDMLREIIDWLSIHQHIIYKTLMFIRDTLHGDNEEFHKFLKLNSDVHSYHTRGEKNFHMSTQNNKS